MADFNGGAGDDSVVGTSGADWFRGNDGNDTLIGLGGNDTLRGGAQNDSLDGGTGADNLQGEDGDDTILGGAGADTIGGGNGQDLIFGGDNDDSIAGGWGDDTVHGEGGNDFITGNPGADYLDGGIGNDTLDGGFHSLSGDPDGDTLVGGDGDDSINANIGDDTITGDAGRDWIQAGIGNDTAHGGSENDILYGNDGNDSLYGDAGNDTVVGGPGDDMVSGGEGNDAVYGDNPASSHDRVGNDTLLGDAGDDSLYGGYANDQLDGGAGLDKLTGGEGFDTFTAGSGDQILDFNTGAGQNIDNGDQRDNDFVDLSGYYNDTNLALINAGRAAAGLPEYGNPLAWLRADQADGTLNDLSGQTINGTTLPEFTFSIQNGGAAVDGGGLTYDNTNVCCFGADAMIATDRADRAAGALSVGDLIQTRDAGLQAIRWIGKRTLTAAELAANPNLRPIRIRKGALGAGLPVADLIVSPQHRILVRSKIAQKMFGTMEVLVAARQLCQLDGIDLAEDLAQVTYVHFLFDDHQIVLANGAEAESLHTGEEALKSVGPAAVEEIFAIFPELRAGRARPAARVLTSGRLGRKLVVRHVQNRKPLLI